MPLRPDDAFHWLALGTEGQFTFEDDGISSAAPHADYPEGHTGQPHSMACLTHQIAMLSLCQRGRSEVSHSVVVPAGAEPVFIRRRGSRPLYGSSSTITIIGWRKALEASYMAVLEDGVVVMSDDLAWFTTSPPAEVPSR